MAGYLIFAHTYVLILMEHTRINLFEVQGFMWLGQISNFYLNAAHLLLREVTVYCYKMQESDHGYILTQFPKGVTRKFPSDIRFVQRTKFSNLFRTLSYCLVQ